MTQIQNNEIFHDRENNGIEAVDDENKENDQLKKKNDNDAFVVVAATATAGGGDSDDDDCYDVIIPTSLFENSSSSIDCSVVIQIPEPNNNPNDNQTLDLEGQSGAIGRFEASKTGRNSSNLVLDFQGYQYCGTLHPGPTCMTIHFTNNAAFGHACNTAVAASLKADAITNEFITLKQTKNIMKSLNAQIFEGTMDERYHISDDNVNKTATKSKMSTHTLVETNSTEKTATTTPTASRKRRQNPNVDKEEVEKNKTSLIRTDSEQRARKYKMKEGRNSVATPLNRMEKRKYSNSSISSFDISIDYSEENFENTELDEDDKGSNKKETTIASTQNSKQREHSPNEKKEENNPVDSMTIMKILPKVERPSTTKVTRRSISNQEKKKKFSYSVTSSADSNVSDKSSTENREQSFLKPTTPRIVVRRQREKPS